MQHLEVSGAVRPIYGSLGVKGLRSWKGENGRMKKIKRRLNREICEGEEEETKEGRKGCTSERISAWRMEEKHKNQRKEIKKRGNQFPHKHCTPIMFQSLTRKRELSLFQSVLASFETSSAPYSVANESSFVGGKMARHDARNSPPSSAVPPLPHTPSWRSQAQPYSPSHSP